MNNSKFDSFFYDRKIIELIDALNSGKNDLAPNFSKDKLYCPECHIAKLKFTRQTNKHKAFLSTNPGSQINLNKHANDCSYSFDKANKKQIEEYYEDLNENQIEDKLDAAINAYLRNAESGNPVTKTVSPERNPAVLTIVENGEEIRRQLPKKSFYSTNNITNDELNIPILLYGTVKLRTSEHTSKFDDGTPYYFIHIYNKTTEKEIIKFYRAGYKDEVESDVLYYVAVIAKIYKDNRGDLLNQNAIKYIRI